MLKTSRSKPLTVKTVANARDERHPTHSVNEKFSLQRQLRIREGGAAATVPRPGNNGAATAQHAENAVLRRGPPFRVTTFNFTEEGEHMLRRIIVALSAVAALAISAPAAFAAGAQVTEFPAAGAVFTCDFGTLTATSGSVRFVLHEGTSASGNMNVTGTIVPQNVTLVDTSGNTYRVVGAGWFGGAINAQTGNGVFTDTEHFQILSATGGVVGNVQETFHVGANGQVTLDKGTCEPPED
jgi:hypothetical protein